MDMFGNLLISAHIWDCSGIPAGTRLCSAENE